MLTVSSLVVQAMCEAVQRMRVSGDDLARPGKEAVAECGPRRERLREGLATTHKDKAGGVAVHLSPTTPPPPHHSRFCPLRIIVSTAHCTLACILLLSVLLSSPSSPASPSCSFLRFGCLHSFLTNHSTGRLPGQAVPPPTNSLASRAWCSLSQWVIIMHVDILRLDSY